MYSARSLLQRYIEAKDLVQPHLMQAIYVNNAVLTFSIATDDISFPQRVTGLDGITETLIVDFGARFSRCKTFYVCDAVPEPEACMLSLPWLVVMRESASGRLRIGNGFYEWVFEQQDGKKMQVSRMHIHIERMQAIEDAGSLLLTHVQSVLPYPWLPPGVLESEFERLAEADPTFAFLDIYRLPISLPD